jgi:hypothetical protein
MVATDDNENDERVTSPDNAPPQDPVSSDWKPETASQVSYSSRKKPSAKEKGRAKDKVNICIGLRILILLLSNR